MSNWSSWLKDNPSVGVVGLIFGGAFAVTALALLVGLLVTLAGMTPGLGFAGLFTLLFLGYFGYKYTQNDDETAVDSDVDPVTELEQQYVRGELSDEEFEHRLDRIIKTEDTVERLDSESKTERGRSRHREVETETT